MSTSHKLTIITAVLVFAIATLVNTATAEETSLTTDQEKVSYAIGYNIANNLKKDYQVDLDAFFAGFKDSQEGNTSQLSDADMEQAMVIFQKEMRQKQADDMKKVAETNKLEGAAFLQANKNKEGVVTLPSGLQYKVLKSGEGASPGATDKVKCHYRGTTIDGKEFDSSYKRGEPVTFPVNGVIPGWTEALQLMNVGAKWMLYIPEDLAYGDRGAGNAIPPGATLIFEVELIEIEG